MTAAPTLEAERDDLIAKRANVGRRLVLARQHAAAAGETKRHLWSTPGSDEAAVKQAERADSEARGARDGLDDHATDLDTQIRAVEAAIVARNDKAAREIAAAEVDRQMAAIEDALADVTQYLAGLPARVRRLSDAMQAVGQVDRSILIRKAMQGEAEVRMPLPGQDPLFAAAKVLHHAIGAALPEHAVTVLVRSGDAPPVYDPLAVARECQLDGLRERALGLRAGTAALSLPQQPTWMPLAHNDVPIAIASPGGFYNSVNGMRTELTPGIWHVPEPIAKAALAKGIGFPVESQDGRDIMRAVTGQPAGKIARNEDGRFAALRFKGLVDDSASRETEPAINLGSTLAPVEYAEAAE